MLLLRLGYLEDLLIISDDSEEEAYEDDPTTTGGPGVPDSSDSRANLMDAIRKAGGASKAGLKKAKDRKQERKAKKEATESPMDLLGDLSAALGRRRKAMSGRDKKEDVPSTGGGSMMDKISAMIPPPPPPGGGGGGDDSGDSEEGGEWWKTTLYLFITLWMFLFCVCTSYDINNHINGKKLTKL